jgi:hypothetical protein
MYDVEQPMIGKFNQTIAVGGWRRPQNQTYRVSVNKSNMKETRK